MTASVNVYIVSHKIIFIVVENLKLMQRSPSHRVEEARMKGQKETKQKEAAQQHQNCPWLPATVHKKTFMGIRVRRGDFCLPKNSDVIRGNDTGE